MYKINIHDRNYDGWTIYDTRDFQESIVIDIDKSEEKTEEQQNNNNND